MMLQRVGFVALLGICSYSGYFLLEEYYNDSPSQITPDAEKPLFTADNISTSQFDEKGVRSYELNSKHIEYFKRFDETHFNEPTLWTYHDGDKKEWKVISDFAVLSNKHILTMSGNVNIQNLLPNAQIQHISTDELVLDLTTRDFWSEYPSYINGIGTSSRSNRIKGNFGSHQMNMTEKVKSIYDPKNK